MFGAQCDKERDSFSKEANHKGLCLGFLNCILGPMHRRDWSRMNVSKEAKPLIRKRTGCDLPKAIELW